MIRMRDGTSQAAEWVNEVWGPELGSVLETWKAQVERVELSDREGKVTLGRVERNSMLHERLLGGGCYLSD